MYALDSNTIGITKIPASDWRRVALYRRILFVGHKGDYWLIKLPKRVARFYQIGKNSKKSASISGGRVLVTITKK